MQSDERFRAAMERFDAANANDPNVEVVDGQPVPAALLYGRRMTQRLQALAPEASEPLRLAVRAQHLMRWALPRDRYPPGRKGYLHWRHALAQFHAETAAEVLREVGYEEAIVARVQALLRKERMRSDAEVQCLEDVACLVFLEHHLAAFMSKHEPDKVVDIVRKTWRKMSQTGQGAALALPLPDRVRSMVARALEPQVGDDAP